ncbi:cellulose-binding protein [Streptomyces sp. NPDC051018]|uniref:cellulose-binding protein n=1 Tax=Streptomyces sp. NPDC051018 TaxID=3365639 RepID=UPI003795A590
MSTAGVPPHGFDVVRRGYRPEQADAYVSSLSEERDASWERAARLTVLAKQMESEAARLRETVAALAPQTYESLGGRARQLLGLAEEEAAALRESARDGAQATLDTAADGARALADRTRANADAVRSAAEEDARQRLSAARAAAGEHLTAARGEAAGLRDEAMTYWQDMRRRAEDLLARLESGQAERWESAEHEIAVRHTALEARHAELTSRAESSRAEAERAVAGAQEYARHTQEDAEARAAELLAVARTAAERTARETDRILREHEESREEMQAHMDHIRNSLASLTGRAPADG